MKKLIGFMIFAAVLLSCCGCGAKQTVQTPQATLDPMSPEAQFGHIDQTVPVDGVYQIWNAEGVKLMSQHPQASFTILCDIDMQGAVLQPIGSGDQPFTGTLDGTFHTISNFTVQGAEETDFGLVCVNQGTVRDLLLEEVTFQPGSNAKNIGTVVGDNQGTVIRCTLQGAMTVSAAAENANIGSFVGVNTGKVLNSETNVDLLVTVPGSANVGGIAGKVTGGTVEFTDTIGKLDVTGSNKTVGLLAGESTDIIYTYCAFIGPSNTIDGKLFDNFTGTEDDELVVAHDSVRRMNDRAPLDPKIVALRDKVVQRMYEMGTVEWHVSHELLHDCKCSTGNVCNGVYNPDITYIGIPYKHGNGSLSSFNYMLDENGYMKDWVWDMDIRNGYDSYMGAMCSSATNMAFWQVSTTINFMSSQPSLPYYYPVSGCIPVGTGWWEDVEFNTTEHLTPQYTENCTEQEFYEVLAQTWHGDGMTNGRPAGYHTVLIATDPVVVRDQQGNIDGVKSYLLTHELTGDQYDDETKTITAWRIYEKNTFAKIRDDAFLPFTCQEYLTGEVPEPECRMLDNPGGYLGMFVGTVKGNYYLEVVTLTVKDSQGNVLLEKINFPKAGKFDDANVKSTSLCYIDSYDMGYFAAPLQSVQFIPGQTYSYTVQAHQAPGYDYVVFEDSFVYGTAQ